MFPFQQSYDLSSQISNDLEEMPIIPNNTNPNYLIHQNPDNSAPATTNHLIIKSPNPRKGRSKKSLICPKGNSNHNINAGNEISDNNNNVAKKRIHRETEKQRRQDMANLYSSLKTLLPLEYMKGKRTICDQITETERYIKDLEKNVKELGDKRDKLKGCLSSSSSSFPYLGNQVSREGGCCSTKSSTTPQCNVNIHNFSNAIDIQIDFKLEEKEEEENVFPLSKTLQFLIDEGIHVVSCASTLADQRRMYIIHCQVNDVKSIDLGELQQRLTTEIGS